MRGPDQQFFNSFLLVFGILICVAVGKVALAAFEEQSAPIPAPEVVAAPLSNTAGLPGVQVCNAVCFTRMDILLTIAPYRTDPPSPLA